MAKIFARPLSIAACLFLVADNLYPSSVNQMIKEGAGFWILSFGRKLWEEPLPVIREVA